MVSIRWWNGQNGPPFQRKIWRQVSVYSSASGVTLQPQLGQGLVSLLWDLQHAVAIRAHADLQSRQQFGGPQAGFTVSTGALPLHCETNWVSIACLHIHLFLVKVLSFTIDFSNVLHPTLPFDMIAASLPEKAKPQKNEMAIGNKGVGMLPCRSFPYFPILWWSFLARGAQETGMPRSSSILKTALRSQRNLPSFTPLEKKKQIVRVPLKVGQSNGQKSSHWLIDQTRRAPSVNKLVYNKPYTIV